MVDLDIKVIPQRDKRLGRQKVHDPRSRSFPAKAQIDRSKWVSRSIRIYDPARNPDQCHGECTGTSKCMQMNSSGNRVAGKVLAIPDAHNIYMLASHNDPWPEAWPPSDTGSTGLASCVAAQMLSLGGEYKHVFNGADEVVQLIMDWHTVSVGTWWTDEMMNPNKYGVIEPRGEIIGGHQYLAHGYDKPNDMVQIRCWWGSIKDLWIKRSQLNDLLMDDGDAHIQTRKVA